MNNPAFKTFPNELYMLQFFGQFLPKLDVSVSARMPPFMFSYEGKTQVKKGLEDTLQFFEERANLGVNVKASVQRGPFFIIFFNGEIPTPSVTKVVEEPIIKEEVKIFEDLNKENTLKEEEKVINLEEVMEKAKSLYKEEDKKASKTELAAYAQEEFDITLNKGKTFEGMISDLEEALSK